MAPLLGSWSGSENEIEQPIRSSENGISQKSILYIDAYDSFSYNVVAMLEEVLNVRVTVMTIDSEWPDGNIIESLQHYEAVVLGPGPGDPKVPKDVGIMDDIWNLSDADMLPVFGICLGFQSLCLRHGMSVGKLPYPLHGQIHRIATTGKDIFSGICDLRITLYHSLYAEMDIQSVFPAELDLLAWFSIKNSGSAAGTQIPMAIRHRRKPFWGVQFHPESCKSDKEACDQLLRRWWQMALDFNKRTGRGGYGALPDSLVNRSDDIASSLPDAASVMLGWCASTSRESAYRTFACKNLTAEAICEMLNAPGSPTVLFQSNGRYSIISMPSPGSWRLEYYAECGKLLLESLSNRCNTPNAAKNHEGSGAPIEKTLTVSQFWDTLRYLMEMKKVDDGDSTVPFWGGFLGYFSYEMGLASLARPKHTGDMHPQNNGIHQGRSMRDGVKIEDPADVSLLWTDRSIVIDNRTGQMTIQSTRMSDDVPSGWLDRTMQSLKKLYTVNTLADDDDVVAGDMQNLDNFLEKSTISFPNSRSYQEQVEACKAELEAGESYELCLTCETSINLPSPRTANGRAEFPWKLYKRLKKYNPAAFSAYARLGDVKIVSSSPECFLNWDRESTLEMKPMKGTVRKSDTMTIEKAREILGSTKEVAENLMIADLIRHDLYGICGSGNVYVEKLLEVEDHGRVYQMITHVKGQVNPNCLGPAVRDMPQLKTGNMAVRGLTALQRCLPPGSMTGAPKERSCMHLSSIEDRKRGIYSGAMGYLDLGGGGSFSVLIRTAFTSSGESDDRQLWRIGAGGAVTTLSSPEGEWDEMLTKLRTVCNIFRPLSSGSTVVRES